MGSTFRSIGVCDERNEAIVVGRTLINPLYCRLGPRPTSTMNAAQADSEAQITW